MDIVIIIILLSVLTSIVVMILLSFVPKKWYCKKMDWHGIPKVRKFENMRDLGECPYCGKTVTLNVDGSWR